MSSGEKTSLCSKEDVETSPEINPYKTQEQSCNPSIVREETIRLYTKRYAILAIFVVLSASNALQWIQYSIISHIVLYYYEVTYDQVNWTSMIYMGTYMILVFPGSWFLEHFGLRKSLLVGAIGNATGAWLKLLSVSRDRFWLTFIAQTIVGSSQIFILGLPSHLAAIWFGPKEVSAACAIGVFGNQLGIAIGFLLPPFLVHEGTIEEISTDLSRLFLISAVVNTVVFLLIVPFFDEKPHVPPSHAQMTKRISKPDASFTKSLKVLLVNRNYILLLITYGINVGVFYAISTLLSQMVLFYHSGEQENTGAIGFVIIISGMFGSVITGFILQKNHHFKATTMVVYFLSFVGMILFTVSLPYTDIWVIILISSFLGFFMTGYLPIGFEFAAELTFPISEGTTSGLLNASAQAFGIAMIIGMEKVIQHYSILWCNIVMSFSLFIGCILTALIKSDLRRQKAHKSPVQL